MARSANDINILSRFLANAQIDASVSSGFIATHPTLTHTTSLRQQYHRQDVESLDQKQTRGEASLIAPTTIVLAGSAILHTAHTLFSFLRDLRSSFLPSSLALQSSLSTLVVTGGKGHSTNHLYTAISKHPIYDPRLLLAFLAQHRTVDGKDDGSEKLEEYAEATLLNAIFYVYYDGGEVTKSWDEGRGLKVLVEDQSTNCGANAIETKNILETVGTFLGRSQTSRRKQQRVKNGADDVEVDRDENAILDDVIIVQDPTMSMRTLASFRKVYEQEVRSGVVRFWCWPTFVPTVCLGHTTSRVAFEDKSGVSSGLSSSSHDGSGGQEVGLPQWDTDALAMQNIDTTLLWDMPRFNGLLLGEIPRLRNDVDGYGPRGKSYISYVQIPEDVEDAWVRLKDMLEHER